MSDLPEVPWLLRCISDDEQAALSENEAELVARVLKESAAKRRVISLCSEWLEAGIIPPGATWSDDAAGAVVAAQVVRLMLLPYADRSGYQPEWAPTLVDGDNKVV